MLLNSDSNQYEIIMQQNKYIYVMIEYCSNTSHIYIYIYTSILSTTNNGKHKAQR